MSRMVLLTTRQSRSTHRPLRPAFFPSRRFPRCLRLRLAGTTLEYSEYFWYRKAVHTIPDTADSMDPCLCRALVSTFAEFHDSYADKVHRRRPKTPVEFALLGPSMGALGGAWLGAIPLALDWERPWQAWPLAPAFGAVFGAVVGALGALLLNTITHLADLGRARSAAIRDRGSVLDEPAPVRKKDTPEGKRAVEELQKSVQVAMASLGGGRGVKVQVKETIPEEEEEGDEDAAGSEDGDGPADKTKGKRRRRRGKKRRDATATEDSAA
jgi:hypothetical protein